MSRHIDFISAPALLVAILSLGLILQLILPSPEPAPTRQAGAGAPPLSGVRFEPAPGPTAFLAQPIFSPDRAGGAHGEDADAITLVGAASTGPRAAIVLHSGDGTDRVLQLGDAVGDWRLTQATADAAVLQRGAQTLTLKIGAPVALPPPAAGGGATP